MWGEGGGGKAASASTTSFLDQKRLCCFGIAFYALSFTVHGFVGGRLLIRPRLNLIFQHQLVEGNQAVRPTSFMDKDERSADQSDPLLPPDERL